ncbi:MAG: ldh [Gammaproteobacteria bacterium]|jgi:leucine dehydrogenase|nr:ldh [Gammaproteobacteria bacterium]
MTVLEMNQTAAAFDIFDRLKTEGFGDIHYKVDTATGLQAIIAIHSTKRGPALGGCRFIHYDSSQEAIIDAMRLAKGMSYKTAIAGLPVGGGKAVIMKPDNLTDRPALFRAFGQFVQELGGRYITALDSGTTLTDMDIISEITPYVGSKTNMGEHGGEGDPAPSTAEGVFRGIQAVAKYKFKKDDLKGLHIAIQGVGAVGYLLAQHLHGAGAVLTVADINVEAVERCKREFGAAIVDYHSIHTLDCDIFSPCALGAILNDTTIPELKAPIVAGGANNQLAKEYHGQMLRDRGIIYAPDYAINGGGIIHAAAKYFHHSDAKAAQHIEEIYDVIYTICERADKLNQPTNSIANSIAEERLR